MRPHDLEIFLENGGGVGEVFAGFEKRADGKFGSPESIGHAGCESSFAGEDLHEEEVQSLVDALEELEDICWLRLPLVLKA